MYCSNKATTKKLNNMITETQLRNKVNEMTRIEMICLRDELESNWSDSLRPLMTTLSLSCIKRFNTTIVNL